MKVPARGQPWIWTLPEGWMLLPFKRVAMIRNGQVDPRDSRYRDLPLFAPNHIESGTGRLLDIESADEQGAESGKYLVRRGEIVYSKIRPALRKVMIAPEDGLCSADMYAIRPADGVDARALFWSMLSDGFCESAMLASERVAMPKVNRETLAEFPIAVAPLPIQQAIADFLNRKTAAIDALIEKKQRLIALLEDKRAAVVQRAVTKGFAATPMKGSGVSTLGDVPAHWSIMRVRHVVSFTTSGSRGWADYYTEDPEKPIFLQSGNLGSDIKLDWSSVQNVDPPTGAEGARTQLKSGDVLICITGAKTGNVAHASHVTCPIYINQHVALLRPVFSTVLPRFLAFSLKSQSSNAQLSMRRRIVAGR